MKKKLLLCIATVVLLLFSNTSFSQATYSALNLGILESFEAFTADGIITNIGGFATGDLGTHKNGYITGFTSPPYTGNQYDGASSAADFLITDQARKDLLRTYISLNAKGVNFPNAFSPFEPAHSAAFLNETIPPGVYSMISAGNITGVLTLDGGNNPDAVFIIKMNGEVIFSADSEIKLTNGAKSSNVFWLANGAINVMQRAKVKGTLFSRAGAINLFADATLEGRMFSMGGAINVAAGCSATPPPDPCTIQVLCESICKVAPTADILGVLSNFALFAKAGAVGNTGLCGVNGTIGTNLATVGGYSSGVHIGSEQVVNPLTIQAAANLDAAFLSLKNMTATVSNHAARFIDETLAPGVYHIGSAGSLAGTVILDANNVSDAIFVFRFEGAFMIDSFSKIILANGARVCNVFWVSGAGAGGVGAAIGIGAFSEVQGTFLANSGACNSGASVFMYGRQLSTFGDVNTNNIIIYSSAECVTSVTLKTTAVTDSPSVAAGETTPSVIDNDISQGVQAVIGNLAGQVTLTSTNTATLTMNLLTGTIAVAANASPSPIPYPITYTICEVSNTTICSTVTSYVTVTGPAATIWDGSTDTAWNDASNWSAGVPLTDGDVIIPVVTNYPVLDQDRSIGNLSIATGATPATGATLSLGGNTLTVKGAFTGDGTLIGSSTSGLTINGTGNQGIFYMNETLGNNKLANFTLNSTVSGSVTLGNAMDIYGVLTLTNGTFNTGGNITLKSNGIGTAVVAPILNCGNVAITGDVTVERFFKKGRAFRLISSPVTTTSTIKANWQEGQNNFTTSYLANSNTILGYGTHITGNMTTDNGFDYTQTTANSMFTFNNTNRAWTAISNTNVLTLTAGDPYRLMIRGSRAINMIDNNATADDTTLRAKGALKICDASAGVLSETSGVLNFIGNPYQAIVEIKKVLTNSTNLNSIYYQVWDPKVSTRGAYVAYTFDGNLSTNTSSDVNAYLQPWQACFVATTSSGASIMFHESDKKTDSQVIENVYRTNNLASYIRLTLYESNTLASNGAAADGLIVKFGENYVNAIDGYDALKLGNLDETFSTKNNTSLLGIESRLLPVASDVIPLNIAQYRFTNYTMVANGTNMSGLPAYLHDQLLQTYTEIPQSDSVNYSYSINANDAATSASDRFRIVFQNPFLNLESNAALVFTMSPNPSKQGVFDVVMNGATADTKLVIYNTIGQEVYATNLTQATINHINPNKVFANGVYYVKIKKDAATTIKKLIIR